MSFNDPGEPNYEIYRGVLGVGVIVRMDGHLIGVCSDETRAESLVAADVARRRRFERENPIFHMAA
jgi:hypothetical protein